MLRGEGRKEPLKRRSSGAGIVTGFKAPVIMSSPNVILGKVGLARWLAAAKFGGSNCRPWLPPLTEQFASRLWRNPTVPLIPDFQIPRQPGKWNLFNNHTLNKPPTLMTPIMTDPPC